MPYCPNCKMNVAGSPCPTCGSVLAPPQPMPPAPAAAPPPPPPQQPYQPQPGAAPMQQPYPQQPQTQQPYPQQPYPQQPYPQQPYPQGAPPKKSGKGMMIVAVIVVIVIILAAVMFLFVLTPEDEGLSDHITFHELLTDMKVNTFQGTVNFKSFDVGDEIFVTGTVEEIELAEVPSSSYIDMDPGTYTIVYFENTKNHIYGDDFNGFAIKGDHRSEYIVGEKAEITLHITEMEIPEVGTIEMIQEWQDAMFASSYVVPYIISLEFTEVSPGTGNYTGGLSSGSESVPFDELQIKIFDSSEISTGYSDDDLTDDSPEVVDTYSGDLVLEYTDVNDNNQLDTGDIINIYNAESDDYVEISYYWDTLTTYTFA